MGHSYTLEHFKEWANTLDRRMSSAVVILESEDKSLIVKANYKSHWTFPGGAVDPGESPKEAAIRELKEETNLDINSNSVKFAWVVSRYSKVAMTYQFVFRASLEEVNLDDIKLQESEIEDWKLVTREEVLSSNLNYSKATNAWARGFDGGYLEQTFGVSQD